MNEPEVPETPPTLNDHLINPEPPISTPPVEPLPVTPPTAVSSPPVGQSMGANKKTSHFGALNIILIIITLAAIGVAVYYAMFAKTTVTKTKTVIEKVIVTPSPTPATSDILQISPLGIQFTLPTTLTGVVYTTRSGSSSDIDLSTSKLTSLDPACSDTGTAPPLGTLAKVNGQYPDPATGAAGTLVKQYSSYYIAFVSPQAVCSTSSTTNALAISQLALFKSALTSVQPIP